MITYTLPHLPMYEGRSRTPTPRQRVTQLANGRQRIEQLHSTSPTIERVTFKIPTDPAQVAAFTDFFNTLGGQQFTMELCLPHGNGPHTFRFLGWGDYGELEGTVQSGVWRYSMELELYNEPLPQVVI